jgi:3-oxoacyl-[acyl-carrier protein] reductase
MTCHSNLNARSKAVLITGAAGGIGLALVSACLQHGWYVFANVRNQASWASLQSALEKRCSDSSQYCQPLVYDVTEPEKVKGAFNEIRKSGKQLQGLVNNAGVMQDSALGMTSLSDFTQQMTVNVTASFQHMQLAARLMTRQKSGSIVNISSIVALDGSAGQVAYSTSKASLLGMTKSAAKELANLNIRVNVVAPGFIETQLTDRYTAEARQKIIDKIEMKRSGRASEIAAMIVHLLSSDSAYITGQCIRVDGMMTV